MKFFVFGLLLFAGLVFAQVCSAPSISSQVSVNPSCRNLTISNVNLSGTGSNVVTNVTGGSNVTVSFNWTVGQGCDYCPGCIYQFYWGIYGQYSQCFVSDAGYGAVYPNGYVNSGVVVPTTPGVYYLTPGLTLDFSCQSGNTRPECSNSVAFGAIVVGSPESNATVSIQGPSSFPYGASAVLSSSTSGVSCTGTYDSYRWWLDNSLVSDASSSSYLASQAGSYIVNWYSCVDSGLNSSVFSLSSEYQPRPAVPASGGDYILTPTPTPIPTPTPTITVTPIVTPIPTASTKDSNRDVLTTPTVSTTITPTPTVSIVVQQDDSNNSSDLPLYVGVLAVIGGGFYYFFMKPRFKPRMGS